MSVAPPAARSAQLDAAYRAQRRRLAAAVTAAAAAVWAVAWRDRQQAIHQSVQIVTAGQKHTVALVDAYFTAKTLQATGGGNLKRLDPSLYTIAALRGVPADVVYERPFGALGAAFNAGATNVQAVDSGLASLEKLAVTDLQLAQTYSARDWMTAEPTIVGYRRVTSGNPCELCAQASTRTYRSEDLMPIHEHCHCTVDPLWGDHAVGSVGTSVLVENDPELGPRLMAATWSSVGPRLIG